MPAPDQLRGLRVVADPAAIDGARWSSDPDESGQGQAGVVLLRFAPDEAFAIGARRVELDDEHAIVTEERGFVAWRPSVQAASAIQRHTEWRTGGEQLDQGAVAGVPVKLVGDADHPIHVVTHAAYAAELAERLGWDR